VRTPIGGPAPCDRLLRHACDLAEVSEFDQEFSRILSEFDPVFQFFWPCRLRSCPVHIGQRVRWKDRSRTMQRSLTDAAQQLICNQQVIGSNPIAGSLGYQRLTQFEPCHEISGLDTSWTLFQNLGGSEPATQGPPLASEGISDEGIPNYFKQCRAGRRKMNGKSLVLDANVLIRAVFGQRVRQLLEAYVDVASLGSKSADWRLCENEAAVFHFLSEGVSLSLSP
jgi:hypothetical protein